jgi:uncharacterized protein (DUF885 family)
MKNALAVGWESSMTGPTPRVREFVDDYWRRFLMQEPMFATSAGEEGLDDRLPDLSEDGLATRDGVHGAALERCGSFGRGTLGLEDRAALDLVEFVARRELDIVRLRFDRFWAVSHMIGGHLYGPPQLLGQIGSLQRADTRERADRYLGRLSAIPRYLAQVERAMADGVRAGHTAPRVVVERSIEMVGAQLATPPAKSPLLDLVNDDELRERVEVTLADAVYPAYASYLDALGEYAKRARTSIGLSALADGDAMYAAEVRGWTTLDRSAEELHDLGVVELAAIDDERRSIAARLGHPDAAGAVAALEQAGRNTVGRDALLALVRDQVQRAWDVAPRFFGRRPASGCEVRPVPEAQENHILDYYLGPTADGSRPGVFYLNTKPRQRHSMATTTFHESNPGHHFQIALALQQADRPALWRFAGELQGAAYAEGWGLYCERLADEMGLYADDYERLGMLELQALRAARLVVDTGIHALGWDRDRALRVLEATGLPAWEAAVEVDRYIAMPGQALCYKLGQREIERWRAAAERDRGIRLAAFHDRLLWLGFLPLPTLDRELRAANNAADGMNGDA